MNRRGAGSLELGDVGQSVEVKGWIHRRRDLGGLIFLQLRDRSGIVQIVVRPDETPEVAEILDTVRLEWVVEVEGRVAAREADADAPAKPVPTTMTEYLRLLAGFTSFVSKRYLSHLFWSGPLGVFPSSCIESLHSRS